MPREKHRLLKIVGPGILVAATGVGAGDLATGAFTGSRLGVAVLWAVLVGAGLKLLLNEGLARWQLATGTSLLEGCVAHFGRPVQWAFLGYLVLWSCFVGAALMSACGATGHAILPTAAVLSRCGVSAPGVLARCGPETDKILYGLLHSGVAVVLVCLGGYRLFQKVMGVCIGLMFVVVVATAVAVGPAWGEIASGLLWPTIPQARGEGIQWTVALMGGVGGTLTVLCYGYWIREEGRTGTADLKTCRIDLATGYAMTALFGVAMVVIGSTIRVEGQGTGLIVHLAEQLKTALGPGAKWAFLVGAWGAIFSSLLGVWQSVPYLFADFWRLSRAPAGATPGPVDSRSRPYRIYLLALATIPAAGLWTGFVAVQKLYAIVGALFIPMLAAALLVLNGQSRWVGRRHRNSLPVVLVLLATLAFFLLAGWFELRNKLLG